jgi:hypothetical protein
LALLGLGTITHSRHRAAQPQADQSSDRFNLFQGLGEPREGNPSGSTFLVRAAEPITPLLKEFVMYGEALQTLPNGANVNLINGGMPAPTTMIRPKRCGRMLNRHRT